MKLVNGDCLDVLRSFESNSLDSLVTDPPAGISFMGKEWDGDKGGRDGWIAWMTEVMQECLRVMKPGAHGLVWAIPRTSHWTATALENAGFEVRDVVTRLFGSGFPKSQNIALAIDKQRGATGNRGKGFNAAGTNLRLNQNRELRSDHPEYKVPEFVTHEAKQWQGWGTALKPASEHWILIRKPLSEKTVAANVQKHGTGGINIDASRVAHLSVKDRLSATPRGKVIRNNFGNTGEGIETSRPDILQGRFPANLVLTEGEATEMLDEQSGTLKSGQLKPSHKIKARESNIAKGAEAERNRDREFGGDSGGASRFFYCAKISSSERHQGMDLNESKKRMSDARPGSPDMTGKFPDHDGREKSGNHHPAELYLIHSWDQEALA